MSGNIPVATAFRLMVRVVRGSVVWRSVVTSGREGRKRRVDMVERMTMSNEQNRMTAPGWVVL